MVDYVEAGIVYITECIYKHGIIVRFLQLQEVVFGQGIIGRYIW
jgi:hypothetical protein